MHVEIGYRKICHLVNCIQLVTMRLSSNLRTGLKNYLKMIGITFMITADNYVKASRNVLSKFINS